MDERLLSELSAYADGELLPAAREALERELSVHPEFQAFLKNAKNVIFL